MASRDIEKIKFPILDMLKKEQQKNISTEEKDEFSEILQEDFKICLWEFSYDSYDMSSTTIYSFLYRAWPHMVAIIFMTKYACNKKTIETRYACNIFQ